MLGQVAGHLRYGPSVRKMEGEAQVLHAWLHAALMRRGWLGRIRYMLICALSVLRYYWSLDPEGLKSWD